jgi:cytochrome c oxidase assembly factor 3
MLNPTEILTARIDAFTIRAVSQDDFEDVKVPEDRTQSPLAGASTITSGPTVK